jgi:hypothetical protein
MSTMTRSTRRVIRIPRSLMACRVDDLRKFVCFKPHNGNRIGLFFWTRAKEFHRKISLKIKLIDSFKHYVTPSPRQHPMASRRGKHQSVESVLEREASSLSRAGNGKITTKAEAFRKSFSKPQCGAPI